VRPRTGCYPGEEFLGLRRLEQLVPPSPQEQVHPVLPEPQGQPTWVQLEQLELVQQELLEPLP